MIAIIVVSLMTNVDAEKVDELFQKAKSAEIK